MESWQTTLHPPVCQVHSYVKLTDRFLSYYSQVLTVYHYMSSWQTSLYCTHLFPRYLYVKLTDNLEPILNLSPRYLLYTICKLTDNIAPTYLPSTYMYISIWQTYSIAPICLPDTCISSWQTALLICLPGTNNLHNGQHFTCLSAR
jgi:hypothetical protein